MKTWFPSTLAREAMTGDGSKPLWQGEWDRVVMMHFAVKPAALRPHVPFELDERDGMAFVSAVAFTLRGMTMKGVIGWLSPILRPVVTHPFLNLRTYVRHAGESGIYFLAEWVPLVPTLLIARPIYGLPYLPGRLDLRHDFDCGSLHGEVRSRLTDGVLRYEGRCHVGPDAAAAGTLTEFLMERYTAFTRWKGRTKRFRVWHPPWPQSPAEVEIQDRSLFRETGAWADEACYVGAHASPGLPMVWMGAPEVLDQ